MQTQGRTDSGRVRQSNQDAYVCGRLSDSTIFAVMCDGMGGAKGGNIASGIAVRVIAERIVDGYRENMTIQSVRYILESAIAAANVEIFDEAMADAALRGMGTTVVAVAAIGRSCVIAHVGDSRAYLVREDGMEQVTRDHSIVQAMMEKGQISESEARHDPRKHFITRALGVDDTVECELSEITLPEDAILLLCTDGLTNMVDTSEIHRILQENKTPRDQVDGLINAANMAGGSDNITAIVLY